MNHYWAEIILAIIALFVGITICVRIVSRKKSNKVNQLDNIVSGDQAGRDINRGP
jgi:hypothetical protein